METEKRIKLETKQPSLAAVTKRQRLSKTEAGLVTAEEARQAAKEVVLHSAADMVRELIAKSGGNYLAVRFLFELAGLIGDGPEDAASEPSPLLRYYLEGMRNTKKTSSEANSDAKSESVVSNGVLIR
jgi:hypothetical protein